MFETGIRQFRLAMAMVWGRPIKPALITSMIDDALATLAEFGRPGEDVNALVDGPFADPAVRRDFADRALRRTVRRLAARSPFYTRRLAESGVDLRRLTVDTVRQIPVTTKAELVAYAGELICDGSTPALSTRTTGSTGRPAEVLMSRYEAELWPAFAALSGLLRDEIRPTDRMAVCISSRATAAVQQNVGVCRLAGAQATVLGVVPPDDALDTLTAPGTQPTLLATYPSYLAQLVVRARARGLGPDDFRLRRVDVGGEVLSTALAAAARETLGTPLVNDTFAMTEVLPVSGRTCSQGHLHHDLNTGLVEVLGLESGTPAVPGELGTVVITPYFPYRECMPVLRYDTRDLVRPLADDELGCELSGVPASTAILGKADSLLYPAGRGPVTTRELVEAIEALPSQPWPARFSAEVTGGRLEIGLPASTVAGLGVEGVQQQLADRGLAATVHTVPDERATALRTVRADLLETTFARPHSLIGVGNG